MTQLNLMLHCGAEYTDRYDPRIINTPQPIGPRHAPFAYADFIDNTIAAFSALGLCVIQQVYGTLKDGSRFFGMMELSNGYQADDYSIVIGLRASQDQSIAAGFAAGAGVFVCDNLSFSGEVQLATKQTTNVLSRMPVLIHQAANKTKTLIDHQHERVGQYKQIEILPRAGDAAITELVRRGAINPSQCGRVIEEWDNPSHEEFSETNVWRLHNAVTEVYKPTNDHTNMAILPKRSVLLTEFCDQLANINF